MGLFSGGTEKKYQNQIADMEKRHAGQITELEAKFKKDKETLENENAALNALLSEKDNAVKMLSQKIGELEKQLSVYNETFATLKDIKASKEEEAYIAHQLRVLDLMRLVNDSVEEKGLDMTDRQNALDKRIQAQKQLKEKVKRAIEAEAKVKKEKSEADAAQFSYKVSCRKVTITGYLGIEDNDILHIPEQIEGYPVTRIADKAFKNMHMKEVRFPNTIEYIGMEAFSGCKLLKKVEMPSKLEEINYKCFQGTALSSVVIPNNVKKLCAWCFAGCQQLDTVVLNEGLEWIDPYSFMNTAIKKIVLPKTIKKVRQDAFECKYKEPLQVAFLGTGNVDIEMHAFGIDATFYAHPNSMATQTARRHGWTVKPLDEFEPQ